MKKLALVAALVASPAMAQDASEQSILDFQFPVHAGNCPIGAQLQVDHTYYEGGATHQVTAWHQWFAGPYTVVVNNADKAEFRAELQDAYADCEGEAIVVVDGYTWDAYKLTFGQGQVTLTVDPEGDFEGQTEVSRAWTLGTGAARITWSFAD